MSSRKGFRYSIWTIPAAEGYSTLLIEYEIVAAQMSSRGVTQGEFAITEADRLEAEEMYDQIL